MVRDPANWLTKTRRAVLALSVAALPFGYLDGATVHAQSIMRSPNLNIGARIPSINPMVAPRINPDIAGRVVSGAGGRPPRVNITSVTRSRIGVTSTLPYARYSPNLYPACSYAYRVNQSPLAPKAYLTGAEWNWEALYPKFVKMIAAGEGIPNFYRGGLKEEIVKVSPYGEAVSAEARKHADDIKAKFLSAEGYTIFKGPIMDNKGK